MALLSLFLAVAYFVGRTSVPACKAFTANKTETVKDFLHGNYITASGIENKDVTTFGYNASVASLRKSSPELQKQISPDANSQGMTSPMTTKSDATNTGYGNDWRARGTDVQNKPISPKASTQTTASYSKEDGRNAIQNVNQGYIQINVSACETLRTYEVWSKKVKVDLVKGAESFNGSLSCEWTIKMQGQHCVNVSFGNLQMTNGCGATLYVCVGEFPCQFVDVCNGPWMSPIVRSNQPRFRFTLTNTSRVESFVLNVTGVNADGTESHGLVAMYTSATSGFVMTPGLTEGENYPSDLQSSFDLTLTPRHVFMISFPHFHLEDAGEGTCSFDYLMLYQVTGETETKLWTKCGHLHIPARVYNTSLRLRFVSDASVQMSGFKMMFTEIPQEQEPQTLQDGTLNCSVPFFSAFRQHLDCNLEIECSGKEDETNCLYKSDSCDLNQISAGGMCYTYVKTKGDRNWYCAQAQCREMGQSLASLNTPEEWENVRHVLKQGKLSTAVYVGLRTSHVPLAAVRAMYREVWQWTDHTMAYYINMKEDTLSVPSCTYYLPENEGVLSATSCLSVAASHVLCEKVQDTAAQQAIHLPISESEHESVSWSTNLTTVQCLRGHVTYDFLACDPGAVCGQEEHTKACVTEEAGEIPMFVCERTSQTVHFTFLCDHREDCSDGSDERFCVHRACSEIQCANRQCVTRDKWCDGMADCVDGTDEECHPAVSRTIPSPLPPALVNLDGHGGYTSLAININDSCPMTHFRCPNSYCLPVYVLCNGVYDCPGREDESECHSYTCPGFYRCLDSPVCLHADHVCDGVFQCPQQDDELLCGLQCPEECRCQGLAFVCNSSFSAQLYPQLRYLDASGSGMVLDNLEENFHLVRLSLAACEITALSNMTLPNLQALDLSRNQITTVYMDVFMGLQNLRVLNLSNNPLQHIHGTVTNIKPLLHFYTLDLSNTKLPAYNSETFESLPTLRLLNISRTTISAVSRGGFNSTPLLQVLDVRDTPITEFPPHTLQRLPYLQVVYADNFKFCCLASLPAHFNLKNCHAQSDDVASCEDLLRLNTFRGGLWGFAVLSILGNSGSFIARVYFHKKSVGGFNTFVTNLSVADFLMGVYLIIVGVADQVYKGEYVWHDTTWKKSRACKIAGFLSFLSNEVSAFFICLITLDRFLALRFPLSRLAFRKRSAVLACVIAWTIGVMLAAVPLLPVTSHWEFYSQTGICIPLPVTPTTFKGHDYAFGVMVILNFILFVLTALGQVFIYLSVRDNTLLRANQTSKDAAVARRLTTVVLSDFLCWFPIGLLGFLASTGTPISNDVNVGIAIFVLPFNSALNPFLYTFNVVMEKRRLAAEKRLLKRVEAYSERSVQPPAGVKSPPVTKEQVFRRLEKWIDDRIISTTDLKQRYSSAGPDESSTNV